MKRMVLFFAILSFGCKSAPAEPDEPVVAEPATVEESVDDPLAAALTHPLRTVEDRQRDQYRHPRETLEFFGVKPTDQVLELWSGGGWYTRILAPYIAGTGVLHVTSYPQDAERDYFREMAADMKTYLTKVDHGDRVNVIPLAPPEQLDFGIGPGSLDVVLTFRNVHNWVKGGYDGAVYEASFAALKSGGTFGVVEHRGPEGMTREESAESGYMDEQAVIAAVEAVGFQLVESSEINANPKDTKDHPEGVWTLPPRLRLEDQDRARYLEIGESDRMTLKFVKP